MRKRAWGFTGDLAIGARRRAFAPLLRAAGVGEAVLWQIFEENPKRFLGFVPR